MSQKNHNVPIQRLIQSFQRKILLLYRTPLIIFFQLINNIYLSEIDYNLDILKDEESISDLIFIIISNIPVCCPG